MLRAKLIAAMGSRLGHAILGKEIIVRWFTDDLDFSPDVARTKAMSIWSELREAKESGDKDEIERGVEGMRSLRRIKNRLNVLKLLSECGEMTNESVIDQWLKFANSFHELSRRQPEIAQNWVMSELPQLDRSWKLERSPWHIALRSLRVCVFSA